MYHYPTERPRVFTEEGQVMFLEIRDEAKRLIELSGAVTSIKLMVCTAGDSFLMLACIDRLVELRELRCVYDKGPGQDYVYVKGSK